MAASFGRGPRIAWSLALLAMSLAPMRAASLAPPVSVNSQMAKMLGPGDAGSGKAATVTPDLFTGTFSYSIPIEVLTCPPDLDSA